MLPYNDTAWINVHISKYRFRSSDITMNDGINYLTRKTHNLYEVFPSCGNSSLKIDEASFKKLFSESTSYTILEREKLMTILTEGYFNIIRANEDLTFLIFWEPFGIVNTPKNNIKTKYSSVTIDKDCKVSLEPILLPDSISNCLVLEEDGYHYVSELNFDHKSY